jgi:hypothetical protein
MSATPVRLCDLAKVIRSKNAGPFRITFDILFDSVEAFNKVRDSGAITQKTIAHAFSVPESQISSLFVVPMARAFKVTLYRPVTQGGSGESDVYGCQQHVPLLNLIISGD